jgi:hypothetical protein
MGIDYLRFIEESPVFVTEHGFMLPRTEYERVWRGWRATRGADTVQTGGVSGSGSPARASRALRGHRRAILRHAERRDGVRSHPQRPTSGTCCYSPTDAKANGGTRQIKVEVNRPGSTLAYRRAVARPETSKYDSRESLATTRPSEAAGFWSGRRPGIHHETRGYQGRGEQLVDVELLVEAGRVKITPMPDGRLGGDELRRALRQRGSERRRAVVGEQEHHPACEPPRGDRPPACR